MARKYMETVLTPAVRAAQADFYGRAQEGGTGAEPDALTEEERSFLVKRDSFYMATVSETGWPYVQHRGGPPGFVKVLSPHRIGFADYRGNRQLLTTGNVSVNDRVALFFMDYPARERLKMLGHLRVLRPEDDPALAARLVDEGMPVERLFVVDIVGFDWNCPKYITPRFTEAEIDARMRGEGGS